MIKTVKEVADLTGISIRTLHYYDEIGLLKPTSLTDAGYRLYFDTDLQRLQQILFFKELDIGLKEIKAIIYSPDFDKINTLKKQKAILQEKRKRLDKIIASINKELEGGNGMDFKAFDMSEIEKHKKEYREEVREKYGDIAVKSHEKTDKYTKENWAKIMGEAEEIYKALAENMDKEPSDPAVQLLIGEWRNHITKYYYNCTIEIFKGLGELYVADERFTKNIDKTKAGLAEFMKKAIDIYCKN